MSSLNTQLGALERKLELSAGVQAQSELLAAEKTQDSAPLYKTLHKIQKLNYDSLMDATAYRAAQASADRKLNQEAESAKCRKLYTRIVQFLCENGHSSCIFNYATLANVDYPRNLTSVEAIATRLKQLTLANTMISLLNLWWLSNPYVKLADGDSNFASASVT